MKRKIQNFLKYDSIQKIPCKSTIMPFELVRELSKYACKKTPHNR